VSKQQSIENKRNKWQIIALLSLLSALVILSGYLYYRFEATTIRIQKQNELTAIAKLKIKEIANWYSDELYDAQIISQNIFVVKKIQKWIKYSEKRDFRNLQIQLNSYKKEHGYTNILLTDTTGKIMLSVNNTFQNIDPRLSTVFQQLDKTKTVTSTDLYICPNNDSIYIDFISTITNENQRPIAMISYRINPTLFLFPLIQSWPNPSQTSETLILRQQGDSIVFLNELRHKKNTALQLRFPLTQTDLPAVQAVSGYKGIFNGIDYRGKHVIAYISPIPSTPWYMVTKIDRHELFADLYMKAIYILAFIILILLLLFTGFAFLFSERQRRTITILWETQEEYRTTLYSIGDAVITTDKKGRIQHLNLIAERLTGWKEKDAHGKQLEEVFKIIDEETREEAECPVKRVLKEGIVINLANHVLLISKDSKEIPIADSSAPIKDKNGEIIGVVLVFHDQTLERTNKKLLVQEMKKSQQYLDVAGVIIVALDNSGNILMINRKGCSLLEYNENDILGKNWFEVAIPEKDKVQVSNVFKQIIGGNIEPVEFNKNQVITRSGELRTVAWYNALLIDDSGKITGTLSSGDDITERQQIEEALAKEKYLFKSLVETTPDNIYFKDTESRFIEINKNMIKSLGLDDPREALGKTDFDFFHKEHAEQAFNDERQIIRDGIPVVGKEEKEVWLNGNITWTLTTKLPLLDVNGKIIGIMGISRDITERKKAEEALRESRERYKMVSQLTSDYIYKIDIDERQHLSISFLSESFYSITGRQLDEVRDLETWNSIFYAKDVPLVQAFIERLIRLKESGELECRTYIKDNRLRWVSILAQPIIDENSGRVVSLIGSVKDITERKMVEEALRESEEKYRILLDESPDPIFSMTSDGRYLYVNRAYALSVEKKVDRIIGKKLWDVFSEEEANNRFSAVKNVFKTGKEQVIEVSIPRSDGDHYYITTITPIKDKHKNVLSVICSSKDITDRKLAEIILRESEEKFRIAFDNAPSGMSIVQANGKYLAVNPMLCQMFGYTKEELLAGKLQDITHPEDIEPGNEWMRKMIAGDPGEPEFEKRYIHKDGHVVWGSVRAQWIKNPDGSPIMSVAHVLDITERLKSQQALKESEEIFRNFMEYSPVYVFFKDENIRSIKLSKNYEKMLGKPLNELLGKTMDELFPSDMAKKMIEDDKSILQEGKLVVVDEELNGRYYTTIKYPIQIDEKTCYLAGFTIDITEKKKAEDILLKQKTEIEKQNQEYAALNEEYLSLNEELRTSNEELATARDKAQESDRLKSTFLANMSHEIRTPMNAIIGFSDLLTSPDLTPEKQQQFTYTIRQRAYDLLALINDILDISKIEAGQMILSAESGNVEEILSDVYNTFKTIWCDSGKSKVELFYENSLLFEENRIITDTGRLRQVLSNLIGNAFKFTSQGSISIGCNMIEKNLLQFNVKDTGIGIPPEKQSIIFDRFRQADEIFSQQFGGTGLGLSISKGLVELLGGKIWVDSKPGQGSNFCFTIPYNHDSKDHVLIKEKRETTYQWEKKKILLVEDDEFNTEYVKEALKRTGVQIVPVVFGREAIELARKDNTFNLVLLDIRLPDIEGFDVAKKIREFRPKLPIIAQTAYASENYKKRCAQVGCVDYLAKPIRQEDLLEAISHCFEKVNLKSAY
jgi:PAS domain S-box-containing protein